MASQLQISITERPLLAAAGTIGIVFAAIAFRDYQNYCSLGPHGLPATFWGWYTQLKMTRMARKDVTVPAPYDIDNVAGPHDKEQFLPQDASRALKWRPGNKAPQIPNFVAPQRQTSDIASEELKKAMYSYLDMLVESHNSVLQTQKSILEGPVPAVGIKNFASLPDAKKPDVYRSTRGEIIHIHPPDGSTHLIMSLADQKSVIETGWGRRHRLSGGGRLPWNYTFTYAPRNEMEFVVWKTLVGAAVEFCLANSAGRADQK
ncbi:phospholipase/carboxylesterase [Paraphaeosphaeria sporulosa]|uniref:Phospholipase/carboxylesterase n=1 Tax=Paraphaeosphaeria sporulosa TaxID=1460663 RepID=A0A177CGT2_9PLEO|nr:phospholipase/carboxylesterase [Paraphaeosphaeria sporulosa]OAG05990.1 phospholipase/carboxylesterase [Paraphaeosphaeria sporulosa]